MNFTDRGVQRRHRIQERHRRIQWTLSIQTSNRPWAMHWARPFCSRTKSNRAISRHETIPISYAVWPPNTTTAIRMSMIRIFISSTCPLPKSAPIQLPNIFVMHIQYLFLCSKVLISSCPNQNRTNLFVIIIYHYLPPKKAINLMLNYFFFFHFVFVMFSALILLHRSIPHSNIQQFKLPPGSVPIRRCDDSDDDGDNMKRSNNSRSSFFEQPRFGINSMKAAAAAAAAAASTKDSPSPPENNVGKQRPAQSAVTPQVNYKLFITFIVIIICTAHTSMCCCFLCLFFCCGHSLFVTILI